MKKKYTDVINFYYIDFKLEVTIILILLRLHYNGPVTAMDKYPIDKLIFEKKIIFVCSTTGQGDQPDNMKTTWKFLLRKNLPSNSLTNVE